MEEPDIACAVQVLTADKEQSGRDDKQDRPHGFTCSCRKQQVRWSLTMPTACIQA